MLDHANNYGHMQQYTGPPVPSKRPPYPTSRYKSVKALLLQWEADDLGVDPEVTKLANVLEAPRPTGFNFSVKRYSIPTIGDDGDPPEDSTASTDSEVP